MGRSSSHATSPRKTALHDIHGVGAELPSATHCPTLPNVSAGNAGAENEAIELRIPARAEHVRVARMAAVAVASRLPFTLDEVEDIKLAVAEACNNAILHGARDPSPLPFVSVSFVALRDRLEICVSDRGRVADVDILRSPSASQRLASGQARENGGANDDVKRELPEGGLGLILIHALMDEVEVRGGPQEDTLVRMVKIAQQNVSRQRDNA